MNFIKGSFKELRLFFIILCIVALYYPFNNLYKYLSQKKISKVSFQGNEIELFNSETDSIFDKHLNDILHLFKLSEADVVIFEDMDRFNSIVIYEKLREINKLLNEGYKVKNKIKFIYLMRDDLFDPKERVKFFDFIIPVIPVIDSSNSEQKLMNIFKDTEIDPAFIQSISLYIDDMRLLKNVYNEYRIYCDILDEKNQKIKLLSMIVYKNIYPSDFCKLQMRDGYVFNLLNSKQKLIDYHLDIINCKLKKLNMTHQSSNDEALKLRDQRSSLYQKNISELITNENKDLYFSIEKYKDILNSKYINLLKLLISKGYIESDYSNYISYSNKDSITVYDKKFLLSILNEKHLEYSYKVINPYKVLKQKIINERTFYSIEILNFDIFTELLINEEFKTYKEILIKTIFEENKKDFLLEYLKLNINISLCSSSINLINQNFIKDLILNENAGINIFNYCFNSILYGNINTILSMNGNKILTKYISKSLMYTKKEFSDNKANIINKLIMIDVKFENICNELNLKSIDIIYEKNMYRLTIDNINLFLLLKYKIKTVNESSNNFTLISSDKNSNLYNYTINNMNEYLENLLKTTNKITDENNIIIEILNNESVSKSNQIKYINNLSTKVDEINLIKNYLFIKIIADKDKININIKNICFYYSIYGFDNTIVKLINNTKNNLNFSEQENNKFILDFLLETKITNDKLNSILEHNKFAIYEFDFLNIKENRMKIFITNKIIEMNYINYNFIKKYYPNLFVDYITNNFEEYISIINELYVIEDIIKFLDSDISVKFKKILINNIRDTVSLLDKNYCDEINAYILKNKFKENEKAYFIFNYEKFEILTKKEIFNLASNNLSYLSKLSFRISNELLLLLLNSENINFIEKVKLIENVINQFPEENHMNLIKTISSEEINDLFLKNSALKICLVNDKNTIILQLMKSNKLIKGFRKTQNMMKYIIYEEKDDIIYTP